MRARCDVIRQLVRYSCAPWCRKAVRRGHLAQTTTRRWRQRRRKAPVLAAPHGANVGVVQRAPAAPPFAHAPPGESSAPVRYAVLSARDMGARRGAADHEPAPQSTPSRCRHPPRRAAAARATPGRCQPTVLRACAPKRRPSWPGGEARGGRCVVTTLRPVPPRCEPTWRTARRRRRRATSCARCATGALRAQR